jgi:hypothetical protein
VVPLLKYTVLRLALFVASMWLLYLLGAGVLVAVIGAAVLSFLLSYVLLRGPRDQLAAVIARRAERRRLRRPSAADQDAAVEDAADDARRTVPPAG